MFTVFNILTESERIMDVVHLERIVIVFDQAPYAKAAELVWQNDRLLSKLVLCMGMLHTVCNLLSIIGKRFCDAGLRDLGVESGVIAEDQSMVYWRGSNTTEGYVP